MHTWRTSRTRSNLNLWTTLSLPSHDSLNKSTFWQLFRFLHEQLAIIIKHTSISYITLKYYIDRLGKKHQACEVSKIRLGGVLYVAFNSKRHSLLGKKMGKSMATQKWTYMMTVGTLVTGVGPAAQQLPFESLSWCQWCFSHTHCN